MRCPGAYRLAIPAFLLSALPVGVQAGNIISTNGYTTCMDNPELRVTALNVQFDKSTKIVTFDVAGESDKVQNVTAALYVTAYGKEVYNRTFNPCDSANFVKQLCPVPAGNFSAQGTQEIDQKYLDMVPSIAFTIPDLDGAAKVQLLSENGTDLACIQSSVSNGQTLNTPAVSYFAGGVAASALALSAISGLAAGGHPGGATSSPSFGETIGWFQTIATTGMYSVTYPSVYSSFAQNFAFSTGLVPWSRLATTVDSFRSATGGNLTQDSYAYLQSVTIVPTSSTNGSSSSLFKRSLSSMALLARDITTNVNGQTTTVNDTSATTTSGNTTTTATSKSMHYVSGIESYVEQLMVPKADTFMIVLLVFACVIAAITVFILLFKVMLEAFALAGTLPKSLESFRKRYWWRLAKTITNLILILYGTWTLYCVYQFTDGDSWAAKTLAAVSWALFTSLLGFFTFRIWSKAREFRKLDGDSSALFENKEVWVKYSLFYDAFKKNFWWLFIPAIVYMFARNAVIAAANGHGMVQAIGQLIVEGLMLILLVWTRPYQLKSGNVINIFIQVVRVLSVVCILVFTEELGISQTTKTITGVALIVVQSVLTGCLAILLAVNAIVACVRTNPHRRRRKEAEKAQRDLDNLTPLDARNSLLMDSAQLTEYKGSHPTAGMTKAPLVSSGLSPNPSHGHYDLVPPRDTSPTGYSQDRMYRAHTNESHDNLVKGAASFGGRDRSTSPKPTLPQIDFGRRY